MNKYLTIFFLEALKRLMGDQTSVKLHIQHGHLRGYRWLFKNNTNNEAILGVWESLMQKLYLNHLKKGFIVYDLGAHHGFLSLLAGKLVGNEGHVYAFEALPKNFTVLTRNVELNKIRNVEPIHLAVSDKEGSVSFSNTINDTANTYISQSPRYSALDHLNVRCNSLDNLVSTGQIALPDFIKIDVEGAEYDVLRGATNLLRDKGPLIYLETHDIHNPGVEKMCIDFLKQNEYNKILQLENNAEKKMASYLLEKS